MTMKKQLMFIALIALILLVSVPAQAQTITISNPGSIGARDVLVYDANGSLWGSYNTSSVITIDKNGSYVFMLKPQTSSIIDDPQDWLTNWAFPYVRSNITAIIIIVGFIGFLIFAMGRR